MGLFDFLQIRQFSLTDIFDILINWLLIYNLLRFIQGSRAMQMAFGLLALFLFKIVAESFQLEVLSSTIGSLFNIIPIAIIVLFQEEIRKVLASIGRTRFFNRRLAGTDSLYDKIFHAALTLSNNRIGALIVFEGEQGLKNYIESGTPLDAVPSYELLLDIFNTKSLLHDGAIIVTAGRIASAACVLPLSSNPNLPRHFGTRHRAAIGISEECDCVALVVSEETGKVSMAKDGVLHSLPENTMSHITQLFNSLATDDIEKVEILSTLSRIKLTKRRGASEKQNTSKQEVSE